MLSALLQENFNAVMRVGSDRDPTAPAQYMAGWFYGVSTEDDRDEIMKCFKQSDDLTNKLYDAMDDFASGDHKAGDELISETKALFEAAV